ncbi:MAG TPA: hypothetical protein VH144_02110, partial [Candidatus Saccharimonadales bacterium]|nr:hypothetical protein [Candidatus Saccharimonadales bacterium]
MLESSPTPPHQSMRAWRRNMAHIPKEARLPEHKNAEQSGWSRRSVLAAMGGLGVGMALGVDNLQGLTTW